MTTSDAEREALIVRLRHIAKTPPIGLVAKACGEAAAALEQSRAASVPAQEPVAWKLVPTEPTEAMYEAAFRRATAENGGLEISYKEIYQAMIYAAPLSDTAKQDRIDTNRFADESPCYLCGYNGPNYFQPDTHPCAAKYHAAIEAEVRKV